EMVALDTDPSVMVIANADEPVFYSENTYWLFRDDHWYRSSSHRSGWVRVDQPPEHLRRIDRPSAYVHFRRDTNAPRATYNERDRRAEPARPEPREPARTQPRDPSEAPIPDQLQRPTEPRPDAPRGHTREPNPQGPTQPYANPRPPQQVPPPAPGE